MLERETLVLREKKEKHHSQNETLILGVGTPKSRGFLSERVTKTFASPLPTVRGNLNGFLWETGGYRVESG